MNDAPNSATTDQFQPSVAAGPGGAVAVAFYDRRANCPADPSILPAHVGDANTCIDVSLQAYKDTGTSAGAVAGRRQRPRLAVHLGPGPVPAEGRRDHPVRVRRPRGPVPAGRGFIGDYFGLAISGGDIYTFAVSTHYPSATVTADDGGPVYYQNQVLGIVPRATSGVATERRRPGADRALDIRASSTPRSPGSAFVAPRNPRGVRAREGTSAAGWPERARDVLKNLRGACPRPSSCSGGLRPLQLARGSV